MCMSPWGAPGLYPCNWGTKQCLRLTSTMLWAITAQAHGRFHCWFLHPLWRWWIFVKIADFGITVHFSKNHMMAKNKTGKTNLATITLNFFFWEPPEHDYITNLCHLQSDKIELHLELFRFPQVVWRHFWSEKICPCIIPPCWKQRPFRADAIWGWVGWRLMKGQIFYFWSWVTRLEQFYRVQRSKKDLMIECSRVGTWNRIQLHVYTPPRSLA